MNLKTEQFEVWVDMPDGSRFLVREIPTSEQAKILAKAGTNMLSAMSAFHQYQFKDWTGVTDQHGKDFPFNPANMKKAIEHDLSTLNEVVSKFNELLDEHRVTVKDLEKNS